MDLIIDTNNMERIEHPFFYNEHFTTPSTEIKRLQELKVMTEGLIAQTGTTLPDVPCRVLCRSNITNYEKEISVLCEYSK